MLALHVSDLTGPSSGAFCTSCIRRLWYVVLQCVLIDTSSRYEVAGRVIPITSKFCRAPPAQKSLYYVGHRRSTMSTIYRISYFELSGYFIWCLAVNIFHIISVELRWIHDIFLEGGASLWIYSLFCLASVFEFTGFFFCRLSVNLLDILSGVCLRIYRVFFSAAFRWIYSTFCLASVFEFTGYFFLPPFGEFTRHFVWRLSSNVQDIFFCRLSVNLLDVLSGVSLSFISVYFISYYGELDRYFVGHLAVRLFDIISGVSQ